MNEYRAHIWRIVTYCEYRVRTREYITWGLCECETFSVIFRIRPPDILGVPGAEELYYRNQTDNGRGPILGTQLRCLSFLSGRGEEHKKTKFQINPEETFTSFHFIPSHPIDRENLSIVFLSFFLSFSLFHNPPVRPPPFPSVRPNSFARSLPPFLRVNVCGIQKHVMIYNGRL